MRTTTVALGIAALILLLTAAGCNAPAAAQWAQQRSALTRTQNSIRTLHQAGVIKDDVLLRADHLVKEARRQLTAAYGKLPRTPDGQIDPKAPATLEVSDLIDNITSLLNTLLLMEAEAQQRKDSHASGSDPGLDPSGRRSRQARRADCQPPAQRWRALSRAA